MSKVCYQELGLSENVGYIPNEIAIFHRDNDQQNQTGFRGTQHFQTHPFIQQERTWKHLMETLHSGFAWQYMTIFQVSQLGLGQNMTKSTHATLEHISWRKPAKTMRGTKTWKNHVWTLRTLWTSFTWFITFHYSLEISSLVTWAMKKIPLSHLIILVAW